MLNNLKENEIEVATKLINGGLSMAKSSMEQILQSPITLEKVAFGIERDDISKFGTKDSKNVSLIKTELKGELKGSCYLVFTESEIEKINKACLPAEILNNDSPESKMPSVLSVSRSWPNGLATEFQPERAWRGGT